MTIQIGDKVKFTPDKKVLEDWGVPDFVADCNGEVISWYDSVLKLDNTFAYGIDCRYVQLPWTDPDDPTIEILEGWFPVDVMTKVNPPPKEIIGVNWEKVSKTWQEKLWDRLR